MIKIIIKKIFIIKLVFLLNIINLFASDSHTKLLNILQKNFPAEIVFKQTSDQTEAEGWMIIKGNGLARTEFAPPNDFIIVADGNWVIFHDNKVDRTTYLPLNTGILQALLDPSAFKDRKEFKVKENIAEGKIIFTVEFFLENNNQRILIYFNNKTKDLNGWEIFENNKEQIKIQVIELKKIKQDRLLEKNIFKLTNQNIEEGLKFYGPYKRKVKKLLKNR